MDEFVMLDKDICRICTIKHTNNWGLIEEMYWNGSVSLINTGKSSSLILCHAVDTESEISMPIPIDKGIPTDCPYKLEHLMKYDKGDK